MSLRNLAAASTVAALTALAIAAPASADADECTPNDHLEITSSRTNFMGAEGNYFKAGPGGTMTVTSKTASTIQATATVTAGVTVEAVVTTAKAEVSASISQSVTVETGQQYSHDVSPGKYGNIQYGAFGFDVDWQKVRVYSNCSYTVLAVGSGKVPTRAYGWQYWETN